MKDGYLFLCLAILAFSLHCVGNVHGQLAITEVMSSATELHLETNSVPQHPDFWELTSFGTNIIELSNHRFSDDGGFVGAQGEVFQGVSIAPGESIIFVKREIDVCTNAVQFRAWWGVTKLTQNLQIYFYDRPRFSSVRDAVQLWRVSDQEADLVDRVELYTAWKGRSFTTDPFSGFLDKVSSITDLQTFKAAETDDVGSPGFTSGAVPLRIIEQPQSVAADAGTSVEFKVKTGGLPRPLFRWFHSGSLISGATGPTLKINAATPEDNGPYTVEVSNGLEILISQPATLEVNTKPSPPSIVVTPRDIEIMPGQTAVFELNVRGYPLPSFQWQFKEQDIIDATNMNLMVPHVTSESVGLYTVQIMNALGSTNASAQLDIYTPKLVITEMMGARSTNTTVTGRGDWWELTNMDDRAVNIRGYRFDDLPRVIEGAFVITNDVIIRPGKSVIFLQEMSPETFKLWWGEENLPPDLQFFRYYGNGIKAEEDSLSIWNPYAVEESDYISLVGYVNVISVDGVLFPNRGFSLIYWHEGVFFEDGLVVVEGECGAFKAANSDDIGSPGYVTDRPPRALGIRRTSENTVMRWRTTFGLRYELLRSEAILGSEWKVIGEHSAIGTEITITDAGFANGQAFYTLRQLPVAP